MVINSILESNTLELLEKLKEENSKLHEENRKLSETVEWMHDTIWNLVHINRMKN